MQQQQLYRTMARRASFRTLIDRGWGEGQANMCDRCSVASCVVSERPCVRTFERRACVRARSFPLPTIVFTVSAIGLVVTGSRSREGRLSEEAAAALPHLRGIRLSWYGTVRYVRAGVHFAMAQTKTCILRLSVRACVHACVQYCGWYHSNSTLNDRGLLALVSLIRRGPRTPMWKLSCLS
ncbi:hypothetical protein BDZ90DRAFT_45185 [Jaminaea rosea]|uniref:Uncharacterized protein n=1 Tax=Jaminaea rosea TaxID=1569628 RepID=A0A316UNV9_9BASI|nr:hypothetical protein BDZ90DRAFT_45185 [Jaminaea rosea]PWN26644.1 hypothetical protein BDZ90DRAFT_45185 [Jaminaea rosea]